MAELHAALTRARELLEHNDEVLAGNLDVKPETLRAWVVDHAPIPPRFGPRIAWIVAAAEREAALRTSGLAECEWLAAKDQEPYPRGADALLKHLQLIERHELACPVCVARKQFVDERFGPLPPVPQLGWMRVFELVDRIPPWARPPVFGAAVLALMTSVRVLFTLPRLYASPDKMGEALIAIVAAAGAGALGGLAYSVARPSLKRLGRPGDYLTGIVCVLAYLGAIVAVAPIAFGKPIVEARSDAVVFVIVAVFFGLVVGHTWFKSEST